MNDVAQALAPCVFRTTSDEPNEYVCRLTQQLLGLSSANGCEVTASACQTCLRQGSASPRCPTPVVASLVYNLARTVESSGGRPDCDVAQAWQTACFARSRLASEEPTSQPVSQRPRSWWEKWRRRCTSRRSGSPRVGMVAYDTVSGLGYLARDLADRQLIDAWLLVDHPHLPRALRSATLPAERADTDRDVERWLSTLDWVLWIESCPLAQLPRLARTAGVRMACVPMWEWLSPTTPWIADVDLMICPTRYTAELLEDWRQRFGMPWRTELFPWPVALEQFPFRQRERCQRFLYVHGRGGATPKVGDRTRDDLPRKGLDLIIAAARQVPRIPWLIRTQVPLACDVPANVQVLGETEQRGDLYREGDICVQPSRWEGLGLPLLECQAAGLPLVTFDLPPMNECRPWRTLPVIRRDWGHLVEGQPITMPHASPRALSDLTNELFEQDVSQASDAARSWVQRERSWDTAAPRWRAMFAEASSENFRETAAP